jgi:hypothetical protein
MKATRPFEASEVRHIPQEATDLHTSATQLTEPDISQQQNLLTELPTSISDRPTNNVSANTVTKCIHYCFVIKVSCVDYFSSTVEIFTLNSNLPNLLVTNQQTVARVTMRTLTVAWEVL